MAKKVPKTVPVQFAGIKLKVQMKQGLPGSMIMPNFDGMSIGDLADLFKASRNALILAAFRPLDVEDIRSYDAESKLKDFKGVFSLDNDLVMTLEGDLLLQAHPYAYGLVEDLGQAKVLFRGISLPDNPFLSLDVKDDSKEEDYLIGIARK